MSARYKTAALILFWPPRDEIEPSTTTNPEIGFFISFVYEREKIKTQISVLLFVFVPYVTAILIKCCKNAKLHFISFLIRHFISLSYFPQLSQNPLINLKG